MGFSKTSQSEGLDNLNVKKSDHAIIIQESQTSRKIEIKGKRISKQERERIRIKSYDYVI